MLCHQYMVSAILYGNELFQGKERSKNGLCDGNHDVRKHIGGYPNYEAGLAGLDRVMKLITEILDIISDLRARAVEVTPTTRLPGCLSTAVSKHRCAPSRPPVQEHRGAPGPNRLYFS
jgi:hypothetical protein